MACGRVSDVLRRPWASLAVAGALAALMTACGGADQLAGSPVPPSSTPSSPSATSSSSSEPPAPSTTTTTTTPPAAKGKTNPPPGRVVVLDPGHNGGNAAHPDRINAQVPDGRGRMKPCNTTGTSTNAGYTEHAFTWDVTTKVRDILTAHGISVLLTRPDDNGVGPCVNDRAAMANQANPAAVVSIHADGSTSAGARGFHVAYSSPPLNDAQGEPSLRLARTLRDSLTSAGFPQSNYIGTAGLSARNDLAGLNFATKPTALVECANMRDAGEAATVSSADGRSRYAAAIADAILHYVS
jgi:N-acetylmuramoyl-L-alanine amidase